MPLEIPAPYTPGAGQIGSIGQMAPGPRPIQGRIFGLGLATKIAGRLPVLGETLSALRDFNDKPVPSIDGSMGGRTVFGGDVAPDVVPVG
jgi:hypothetical protein